jgi:adenylate kinase family enzyme
LQDELVRKARKGCDVRVLAPLGLERLAGAYELRKKGIPTRHLSFLDDDDLRFTLVDLDSCIISSRVDRTTRKTSEAISVRSHWLAAVLGKYADEYWHHPGARDFIELLGDELRSRLSDPKSRQTPESLAATTLIPTKIIHQIMDDTPKQKLPSTVLIIGRPGAGKSTAAYILQSELCKRMYPQSIFTHSDYRVLYNWSRSSSEVAAAFQSTGDGFEVVKWSILDDALGEINRVILRKTKALHVVEFARGKYLNALKKFSETRIAAILYIDCSILHCKERNQMRWGGRMSFDSGFVPPEVMTTHYNTDDLDDLKEKYPDRIRVIKNESSRSAFADEIRSYAEHIASGAAGD